HGLAAAPIRAVHIIHQLGRAARGGRRADAHPAGRAPGTVNTQADAGAHFHVVDLASRQRDLVHGEDVRARPGGRDQLALHAVRVVYPELVDVAAGVVGRVVR